MKDFKFQSRLLLVSVLFLLACASCAPHSPSDTSDRILVRVRVLTDKPLSTSEYRLKDGTPRKVGVYRFYLKQPDLPGSGAFEQVDSIRLKKTDGGQFYGEKWIKRTEDTLCVGYPATNMIDQEACVQIDPGQSEIDVVVHFWETRLGIL